MMSVFIIGDTSVIGKALGDKLMSNGVSVSYGGRNNIDTHVDLSKDIESFEPNQRYDVVIACAADFGGDSYDDLIRAEKVNALGSLRACELARRLKAKHLIMISSLSATYSKNDNFYNIYSISKKHGDELAQFYCDSIELPLTILMPSQVYDCESNSVKHQAFFYSIIDKAEKGEDIVFYGKNDAIRNFIYLDDFCEIVFKVIQKKVNGLYECAFPSSTSISQIAELAYEVFDNGGNYSFDHSKPDIFDLNVASNTDLYKLINFTPKVDMLEGIVRVKNKRVNLP